LTIEEGTQVHNAIAIGGQITVDGLVENNVIAIGGSVVLTKTAVIGGNAISLGGIVAIGKGAEVHGTVTELNLDDVSTAISTALSDDWEGWSWIFAVVSFSFFIGLLVLTLLIVHFLPKPIRLISKAVRDIPFKVMIWGVGALILIVPLAVLLAISVVGIVLIPIEMTLLLAAVVLGFIAVSQRIGETMFTVLKRHDQTMVRETIWGLIILWGIGWIPYVGWTLKVLAVVLGIGGVLVTRFGTSYNR
jgi:hypothetical protein